MVSPPKTGGFSSVGDDLHVVDNIISICPATALFNSGVWGVGIPPVLLILLSLLTMVSVVDSVLRSYDSDPARIRPS